MVSSRAKLDYQLGYLVVRGEETAAHHDIALLFIESQELDFANSIPRYIIDIDGCEI